MNAGHYIAKALRELRQDAQLGLIKYPRAGICENIAHYLDESWARGYWRDSMRDAFRAWPKFSGCSTFPVPCPEGLDLGDLEGAVDPEDWAYCSGCLYKWFGPYGDLRFELLDHLIEWFEKEGDDHEI